MTVKKVPVLVLWLMFSPIYDCLAQFDNKRDEAIQKMIRQHPLRLGIFRVRPEIEITSGYNSNVFSNSLLLLDDYYFSISPGTDIAVKLGHHGFLAIDEHITFLRYREFDQLNDLFNSTSAGITLGNRRILLSAKGMQVSKKAPINYEFDAPADQKTIQGTADFSFSLTSKSDLGMSFTSSRNRYQADPRILYPSLPPPDYHLTSWTVGLEQILKNRIAFRVDYTVSKTEFLNTRDSDTFTPVRSGWNILTGLVFRSRKLVGRARVGYGAIEANQADQKEFRDFLIDTDFVYSPGRKTSFGITARRQRQVSALLQTSFHLLTEGGVKASVPLSKRFFLDGAFLIGQNDYGKAFFPGKEAVTRDRYTNIRAGFNTYLSRIVILRVGMNRLVRDSNLSLLDKDRSAIDIAFLVGPQEKEK